MNFSPRKIIGTWLLAGCCMVFFQVIVGGVTRLTESGLSITEWKPVKGIVPPMNEHEWKVEFELYKTMTQFQTINQDMTLAEFKWIYFWEYFHRFWARFMGFVFAIPFAFFLYKKWLDKEALLKIAPLFLWGGIEGAYGWYMVSNGLKGVYVPPIHLAIHLLIALALFAYLVWVTLYFFRPRYFFEPKTEKPKAKSFAWAILAVLFLQIFFGGITSGMKAGLAAPTWPDINDELIPSSLWQFQASTIGFTKYDAQDFWGRIFIQVCHRTTAYILVFLAAVFYWNSRNITSDRIFKTALNLFPFAVLLQVLLGIITVVSCVGKIPVLLGVLHQIGAMLLLANTTFIIFHLRPSLKNS